MKICVIIDLWLFPLISALPLWLAFLLGFGWVLLVLLPFVLQFDTFLFFNACFFPMFISFQLVFHLEGLRMFQCVGCTFSEKLSKSTLWFDIFGDFLKYLFRFTSNVNSFISIFAFQWIIRFDGFFRWFCWSYCETRYLFFFLFFFIGNILFITASNITFINWPIRSDPIIWFGDFIGWQLNNLYGYILCVVFFFFQLSLQFNRFEWLFELFLESIANLR